MGAERNIRFAAKILARSLLQADPSLASRELGLEDRTVPFPVLIRLSEFAEFLRDHPDGSCAADAPSHLLRFLDFSLRGRLLNLPHEYLRQRVVSGGSFLFLDGLDEVPQSMRIRICAIIDELVATTPSDPPNHHLITCRTRAYSGLTRLGGLPSYSLAPFEADQVIDFVRGWSRALFQVRGLSDSSDSNADRYEQELLGAIESHKNVSPMTRSPLMLTMLAVVHWSQKKLPERRNELYEEAVKYLIESRQEHSSFPAPQRREALQALALAMFRDKEGVQRSLGLAEAGRAVAPVLQVAQKEARAFLDEESLRSGVLVSRSEGELEFWHLSFQEYLAALELSTREDYWELINNRDRLYDDRWSEVIYLLAGCLRRLGGMRAAKRFVERILDTGTDKVSLARAVALTGRVLSDIKLYGGDPSNGTRYARALGEIMAIFELGAESVEDMVRIEVGEALGKAGDPRLAAPEANRILISGGTFWMGAQNEDAEAPGYDPEANEDESPAHRVTLSSFYIGKYPVTVQEFRLFVEAGDQGYSNPKNWDANGWALRKRYKRLEPDTWDQQVPHPNWPVTNVSWYEADAYCRWVGGRLPTEAEWEFAARGVEGRRFPWGSEAVERRRAHGPFPIGVFPQDTTPEGVRDLVTNVEQWCADWRGPYWDQEEKNPTGTQADSSRIRRGEGYYSRGRAARRRGDMPGHRARDVGFRVVWSADPGAL